MYFKSTGKRRYGHPALTGVLPQPWLPIKKGQSLANRIEHEGGMRGRDQAVVLTLRRRYSRSVVRRDPGDQVSKPSLATLWNNEPSAAAAPTSATSPSRVRANSTGNISTTSNPWRDRDSDPEDRSAAARPLPRHAQTHPQVSHRLSFDHATGVITLPEDGQWILQDEDSDSEEGGSSREATQHEGEGSVSEVGALTSPPISTRGVRHRTYYHHPERRRTITGAFSQSSPQS